MSFNDNVQLDTSNVRSGGGRGGPIAIGGGAGGILLVIVLSLLGVNVDDVLPGGSSAGGGSTDNSELTAKCRTGADANRDVECRVIGTANSADAYWTQALPQQASTRYTEPSISVYRGQDQSACGTASNAVGPFYCPTDTSVYIDASFFDELTTRFGADDGALAQEYVVAHEYGHHVQHLLGVLGAAQQDRQGADSGSVRIELMADCLAGMWARSAATTQDAQGSTYLQPLTQNDIDSALSAAASVGDDRIQQKTQGRVDPEGWTHGSAEQRQRWFTVGYQYGQLDRCNTLEAARL